MTIQSSHPALSAADGLAGSLANVALLAGRILLGWIFVRSGFPKLLDISAVMATYPGRGLPPMLAYIAVPFEFFGGLALIFGLATRYVVLGFFIFMLVATFRHTATGTTRPPNKPYKRPISTRTWRCSVVSFFCSSRVPAA